MDSVNANLTILFIRFINNSLKECLYPATLVDLHWELCATDYGILVSKIKIDNNIITMYNNNICNNDILKYIEID